jgi:hypothetical protein
MKPLSDKEYDLLLESFLQQNNQSRFSKIGKINPINKPKQMVQNRFGRPSTSPGLIRTVMGI